VSAFPIVALVCSAGGLDALTLILTGLPADLPAAVIVLQHQSPDCRSELATLLGRRTRLPVEPARDGGPVLPGRVYVAPSGQHTVVAADETIALVASGQRPPYRPSADLLLTSLAVAFGERAIAVVLTGRGNDAATGASLVHRFGGTVVVCTVATSAQSDMPQATIDLVHHVDHVTALGEVADLLRTLVTTPPRRTGST
jgi:two-component system, chemotaxis family, protein-glutamate methylesterase/glutaminase